MASSTKPSYHETSLTEEPMRLYRGLDRLYRPDKVLPNHGTMTGTDFTDCPFTALQYARGRRGVVLVLDSSK